MCSSDLQVRAEANQAELATWERILMFHGNRGPDLALMHRAMAPIFNGATLLDPQAHLRLQGCVINALLTPSTFMLNSEVKLVEALPDGQVFHSRLRPDALRSTSRACSQGAKSSSVPSGHSSASA